VLGLAFYILFSHTMWYRCDFKKPKILVYVQLRDSTAEINRSLVVFFDRNSNYFVQKKTQIIKRLTIIIAKGAQLSINFNNFASKQQCMKEWKCLEMILFSTLLMAWDWTIIMVDSAINCLTVSNTFCTLMLFILWKLFDFYSVRSLF
jgi:hypothetical protein